MPTNLTVSALLDAQARLSEIIAGDTPSGYPKNVAKETARALLREHNARVSPVLQGRPGSTAQKFVGMRVYWLKTGSMALDYNGDGGVDFTPDCEVEAGAGSESDTTTYTNNLYMQKIVETEDDLSENLYEIEELVAERLLTARLSILQGLNTRMVNFLNSNKTGVNDDAETIDGVNFNAGVFEIDPTIINMREWQALTDLDAIMANNRIQEWFYISGRHNFFNAVKDARYLRRDDDKRSESAFDDYNMYFDQRALDSTLNGRFTFGVGRGTYVFWDRTDAPRTPIQVSDNAWEYFIEDPEIMLMDNGRMRPLRYNVRYQKICTGVSKVSMRSTYRHVWEFTLFGGLYPAPASESGNTGLLAFKSLVGG